MFQRVTPVNQAVVHLPRPSNQLGSSEAGRYISTVATRGILNQTGPCHCGSEVTSARCWLWIKGMSWIRHQGKLCLELCSSSSSSRQLLGLVLQKRLFYFTATDCYLELLRFLTTITSCSTTSRTPLIKRCDPLDRNPLANKRKSRSAPWQKHIDFLSPPNSSSVGTRKTLKHPNWSPYERRPLSWR